MTPAGLRLLQDLRRSLLERPASLGRILPPGSPGTQPRMSAPSPNLTTSQTAVAVSIAISAAEGDWVWPRSF
jgi:hypothetical protein